MGEINKLFFITFPWRLELNQTNYNLSITAMKKLISIAI